VFTGNATLEEITKQWHVSLPNMTFYPSVIFPVFHLSLLHAVTVQTINEGSPPASWSLISSGCICMCSRLLY